MHTFSTHAGIMLKMRQNPHKQLAGRVIMASQYLRAKSKQHRQLNLTKAKLVLLLKIKKLWSATLKIRQFWNDNFCVKPLCTVRSGRVGIIVARANADLSSDLRPVS
jgi:hypothetical protein